MNRNKLAVEISKLEGKKKEVNIAQIKEILKCLDFVTYGEFNKWIRKQKGT